MGGAGAEGGMEGRGWKNGHSSIAWGKIVVSICPGGWGPGWGAERPGRGGGLGGGAAAVLHPGVFEWLRQLGVDEVQLVTMRWAKLVAPDKERA